MAQIRDLMTSNIETLGPDATAQEAATAMRRADTGSIPVVEGNRVVGLITDRDIAIRAVAEGRGPDCSIRDLMSADPVCAYESDDVESIAQRMAEAQVRRLPVVDQNEQLIGMISLGDLSREGKEQAASEALQGVSADTNALLDA
ncbi:CBS domain-containing protein [Sphingomonas jaspsi]|uniref:CBS domain-containing protein n=1 Tax=Sphingomonas jaspsi TaxID=392409 RepID=UPI0004BC64D4|nr:CBS domain-containing protein [Sphingomonas jaspsi]